MKLVTDVTAALHPFTQTVADIPSKAVVTQMVLGAYLLTRRLWHSPPPPTDILQSSRALRWHVIREGFQNAGFFGAMTFLVLLWHTGWLTWPFVLWHGALFIHGLVVVLIGIVLWVGSGLGGEQ